MSKSESNPNGQNPNYFPLLDFGFDSSLDIQILDLSDMFFLFSLIITLLLFYFTSEPQARLWAPYTALGVIFFGSWAFIHERRFVRALPLVSATTALFFASLLLETVALRNALIVGIGASAWVWWRTVGVRAVDSATEQALLRVFVVFFTCASAGAAFAFAIYVATPLWFLSLILFLGALVFFASSFQIGGMPSWFLAAVAIAFLTSELFLVVHLLPVAIAVKALTVSLILLTIIYLADRSRGAPLTPRVARIFVGIALICVTALLATAAWV